MTLMDDDERRFLHTISDLSHCNPFLPERLQLEREALGADSVDVGEVWSKRSPVDNDRPGLALLADRLHKLLNRMREELLQSPQVDKDDLRIYEDGVLFLLYHQYRERLSEQIESADAASSKAPKVPFWGSYREEFQRYLKLPGVPLASSDHADHWMACFFQLRRAFHHIFHFVVGQSKQAARLRAQIWQSIFTYDMRRYRRALYDRMGDITTLIIGPSGTGKELAARAIGLSRYIPFDAEAGAFPTNFAAVFHTLNVSALAPTLVESELFGHRRGAFTGAVSDRVGWLESCETRGTIFLDEIGDLDASIQVKMLRVLQSRVFQRLGDTEPRNFSGKVIVATNRDLGKAMREGRFRQDFYYRLCADIVQTPSLVDQLRDCDDDLNQLLYHLASQIVPEEAQSLADETRDWIRANLPSDYAWPGNIRELDQCLRNVLVRGRYEPPHELRDADRLDRALSVLSDGDTATVDELLHRYCTLAYARWGSYEAAAKRLGVDRRTLKSKVDDKLLARLRGKDDDAG